MYHRSRKQRRYCDRNEIVVEFSVNCNMSLCKYLSFVVLTKALRKNKYPQYNLIQTFTKTVFFNRYRYTKRSFGKYQTKKLFWQKFPIFSKLVTFIHFIYPLKYSVIMLQKQTLILTDFNSSEEAVTSGSTSSCFKNYN